MSLLIGAGKLLASLFLLATFITGAFKANPKTHIQRSAAEYVTGFLFCFLSALGLYYLWY